MALLELERDVREAELCDIEENGSVRSPYDIEEARNLYPNVRIVNPCENPLSSPISEWKFNVADEATRTYTNLQEHMGFERWINGPEFLMNFDENTWPTRQIKTKGVVETTTEHENFVALTVSLDSNKIDFEILENYKDNGLGN
ncbi:hypothetical protein JTB14_005032 [Gonioctena quinquepunctata]|nr:hypothetical protein JTB14_005032 [Gonioctena quinquepunctata]